MELPGRIVLASANPKKAAELTAVMAAAGRRVELLPRPTEIPDIVEDADTFEGNARIKAVVLAERTGEVALADDSGLIVDALGGAPGVHSARYACEDATDADNVEHLLAELDRVGVHDAARRGARFHCVLILRRPDGTEVVAEGTVEGHIAPAPVGELGFGYDPVFIPSEGDGRTFAQMDAAEKNEMSHRARAVTALVRACTA